VALAYALPAAAATVALRTEGVIFVIAAATVVALSSVSVVSRSVNRPTVIAGIALGVTGVATYLLDNRVAKSIGGSAGYGTNPSNLVLSDRTGPLDAIWSSLFRPFNHSWASANTMV